MQGLRYLKSVETDNVVGKLFLFDYNNVDKNKPKANEIKLIWDSNEVKRFNPHGIKSHVSKTGTVHFTPKLLGKFLPMTKSRVLRRNHIVRYQSRP